MNNLLKNIHPNTAKLLGNLKNNKDFPTVMVFHGPKSENKELFALHLIEQAINRDKDPIIKQRIMNKVHPDVQVFSCKDQEQYPLLSVKGWVEEAGFPPFELSKKWMIIDDAEKLTAIHCNTLLKTLEEPDCNVHFILIVESLSSLVDTVNSRAIKIPFFPLSSVDLEKIQPDLKISSKLLKGSLELIPFVEQLNEIEFFKNLDQVLHAYKILNPHAAWLILEEIEKSLSHETFIKKSLEIYELAFSYILQYLRNWSESQPQVLRKIPKLFDLNDLLIASIKRHTKLRYCLEQLILTLFQK